MLTATPNTILIVDDQPTNLKMLFSFLQESGFKVLVAQSGESAIRKLEKVSPDLILLDVMLPVIDGFETCRRLKSAPETQDIPVIFMTALSESLDKIKGLKVGAVDYITKPFQQEEVLARIQNQLKIRRLQKQLEEQNHQLQDEIRIRRTIEERLELVIQAANDGFWDWNLESGEVYISPRCKEILGYSDEELASEFKTWEDNVFPEDRITALKLLEDYNSGQISRFQSIQRFRHKNGSTVHTLARALHLKDAKGQVTRLVGTYTDITEMTKATEALQQSQLLLAGVLNSSLDGVAAFSALRDSQGNIVDFIWLLHNQAAETMVGRTQGELLGKQLLVEMPGIGINGLFEQFVTVVETGEPLETELYYAHENIQAWLQIAAVKFDDGFAMTFRDITERKQAESALRNSEARFRGIFESAAIGIGLTGVDGRLFQANPTLEAFLGYRCCEMQRQDFANITHPDDRSADSTLTQQVIDGVRDSFQLEKRYIRKDSQIFWGRLTVSAVRDREGEFQFTVAILEDINDRKLRELALKESERRFRAIFNNSFQFTGLLTPNGTVIEVNQTALDFGGVKPSEVVGLPFWETCWWTQGNREHSASPSPKQEQLKKAIQEAASGQFVRYEVEVTGVADSAITLDFSIKPVLDETGNVVLLIPEGRDISDRKKAQEALLIAQKRLEYLLSSNPSIIYTCQTTEPYATTFISENITALFGYKPQEFLEDSGFWISHIHPDDRDRILAEFPKRIEQKNYSHEYRFLHKDGTYRWVFDAVKLVRNKQGIPIECIGSLSDITQRKQVEAALHESQRWLCAITEANPNVLYVYDLNEQRNIYSNRQMFSILGYTSEEVQQMGAGVLSQLMHPDDLALLPEHEKRYETAKEGKIFEIEYRMRHKNGEWRWLSSRDTVFTRDTEGKPKQILGTATDISDRKQVEEALRQSEERFQLAIEGSGLGLWDWNISTREIYFSPHWKAILGYEVEEIEDSFQSLKRLIHPEDKSRVLEAINAHLKGHSPVYETEFRMLSKQGEWKWILSRGKLTERDASGKPLRMTGTHKDISDRKAIAIALEQSEARLQKLAASVPGMLYEYLLHPDGSSCFTYVSSVCREINEMEPEQLLENAELGFELTHPDDRHSLCATLQISAQTLEPWAWEGRIITPSGMHKWVRGGARPERHANGDILWHGLVVDVSDRKLAEVELKTAKVALERKIQRILLQERITQEIRSSLNPRRVFQTAAIQIGEAFGVNRCLIHTYIDHPTPKIPLVAEYRPPGLVSLVNLEIPVIGNSHAQLMLAQDKAIASNDIYTDPLLEAAVPLCQQLSLKSMLAVRTSYQGKPNGAIGLHQYDRFRHWTEEEIELIESVAAQLGIAIAQANLLEQEKQQRRELALQNHALEKAKLEAEAANRAKSQFLSKMSHELRTPLNAILGFTQVIARDESLTLEQKDYLEIINRSGEHLLDLINDILSMSKIEAGQVSLNSNRFDLYRLLDSLEEMLQLRATSKGLNLLFERASDVPQYIQTDESKLRQVLINLLGNAIKFTQTGHVTLRVSLVIGHSSLVKNKGQRTKDKGQTTLQFEVEDSGPGIAPEEMSSLFDPFMQTETGRQSMEGSGLGLPISQQFIRMMGGEISVSSTLGQGTIFTFDIQVGLATSADEKPMSGRRRVIGLKPNQPSYRILVVEDAAVNRKLLLKILEPLGFEVRTADNGQEAVALSESWSPHLIWMDVIMPVMDGYEATKQIKQTAKGQKTIIIALTASAFEEQQEAILRVGCDDFLPKPFQREVLLEKMAHHLGVRYVYEQQETSTLSRLPARVQPPTAEALAVMPASWMIQLHQAALYADDELMKQLVEQIPLEHGALRRALRALIDNFLLEQIINLTQSPKS